MTWLYYTALHSSMPQTALYFTMLQISAIPNCLSQLKDANCINNFIVAEISVLLSTQIKDTGERIKFYDMTAWDMTLWSLHLSVAPFTHAWPFMPEFPEFETVFHVSKAELLLSVEILGHHPTLTAIYTFTSTITNINHLHTHLPFPSWHITATVNTSKNIHL